VMPPALFIIAGPNGAGKSLFSSSLVEVDFEVFDGDKYIAELKVKYPETGSDVLQTSVNENQFYNAKELAIKTRGSFAFETNFSSDDPTQSLRQFKNAGYHCHLIFMGLNTIGECVQRVSMRVKAGGHKVPESSIEYNYVQGHKNLYTYYDHFDTVTLMDSSFPENEEIKVPEKILLWRNGRIKLFKTAFPKWVEKFIAVTQGQK